MDITHISLKSKDSKPGSTIRSLQFYTTWDINQITAFFKWGEPRGPLTLHTPCALPLRPALRAAPREPQLTEATWISWLLCSLNRNWLSLLMPATSRWKRKKQKYLLALPNPVLAYLSQTNSTNKSPIYYVLALVKSTPVISATGK